MSQRTADTATSDAESSRISRLKDFEKEADSSSDVEPEETKIEEVVTLPASGAGSRNGSCSEASIASHQDPTIKKIIRFKEGDPDNPDNWRQVHTVFLHWCLETDTKQIKKLYALFVAIMSGK